MRARPTHATLYDFRDMDLMFKLAEEVNGSRGILATDLAELLGFEDAKAIGMRLAWMRRYGMLAYNENERLWNLSTGGRRVIDSRLKARELKVVDELPDEAMVEVMAHVTSRYHHGKGMIGNLLRREFLFGTQQGRRA